MPPQGFEIKSFAGGIVIAGHDSALLKKEKEHDPFDKDGITLGTLWGACDFTERILGCRYYFPGDYGSIWPKITDLTVTPVHYTDYPRFSNRDGCWIGWTMHGQKNQEKWEPLLGQYVEKKDSPDKGTPITARWRLANFMGPIAFHPGHDPNPPRVLKFFPDRKNDIFFTNSSGYMYYNDKQHIGNDFDLTNLKFADIIIEALKKYYASNGKDFNIWSYPPTRRFVNFGQCDGEVPLADMLSNPTVKELNLITEENIKRGSALSDVYGRFLQYFANRVKEEFPGLKVAFMPYQGGTYPPLDKKRWALPDNVSLRVCTHDFPRLAANPKKCERTLQNLREWYEATGNNPIESLWFYHIPENSGSPFIRAIASQYVGESVRLCGKYLGRTNIFFDQYGDFDWSYYYSEYCGTRSMWNPDFDVDAAIDEHWAPFYGANAAPYLKEFHKLMKECYLKYYVMPPDGTYNPLFPPMVLDKLESLLNETAKNIKPGTVEAKRFALFNAPWAKAIEAQRARQNYVRPIYNVHRLLSSEKINIDGDASDTVWQKLTPMSLRDPKGSGDEAKFPASIKLAWDDNGLYCLAQMPYAPCADKEKSIWQNDSCEFFFSPGVNREEHFQYTVDSIGQKAVGHKVLLPIATPYNGQWPSPGFKHTVKNSGKDGWTIEFFVPYADMKVSAPKAYETWNANFVHNKLSTPAEYFSSAMTLADNHNIEMFGSIKFLGKGD